MSLRRLTAMVAVVALGACAEEGPISGPVSGPGTMIATLVSPNGTEGAALVVLTGDGIGDITPVGTTEVHSLVGSDGTRVLLINEPGGELAFSVAVADTTRLPTAVIEQVAGPDDELRATLSAYRLELAR